MHIEITHASNVYKLVIRTSLKNRSESLLYKEYLQYIF